MSEPLSASERETIEQRCCPNGCQRPLGDCVAYSRPAPSGAPGWKLPDQRDGVVAPTSGEIGPEGRKLQAYYERKAAEGLVDVKFAFGRPLPLQGVTAEELCAEVNRLNEAIEQGHAEPFCFNDRHPSTPSSERLSSDRAGEGSPQGLPTWTKARRAVVDAFLELEESLEGEVLVSEVSDRLTDLRDAITSLKDSR